MSSGIVSADRQPASLPHSAAAGDQSDALPDRVQVRPAGSVQRDEVSQRNLRVMRGEEVVRSVPRGAVLPGRDQVCAVPGRVLLRGRQLCAEAVPGKQLLPAGVFGDDRVPGRQEVDAWGEVGPGLYLGFKILQALVLENIFLMSRLPSDFAVIDFAVRQRVDHQTPIISRHRGLVCVSPDL